MLRLFKGTCEAIRAMHDYRAPLSSSSRTNQSHQSTSSRPSHHPRLSGEHRLSGEQQALNPTHSGADMDEDDDDLFPQPEGDSEGGYSYHGSTKSGRSAVPLMTKHRAQDEGETIYDGDEELARIQRESGHAGETELVPYSHRDLKPGYVPFLDNHLLNSTHV